jgi:hypothetical protein
MNQPQPNGIVFRLEKYWKIISAVAWAILIWILMFADNRYMKAEDINSRLMSLETRITALEAAQIETKVRIEGLVAGQTALGNGQDRMLSKVDSVASLIKQLHARDLIHNSPQLIIP